MEVIKKPKQEIRKYQLAVVKQMLQLATSGFGLVAALAWNELIRTFINEYIKTKISVGSGIISLAIYAVIITALAVIITLHLSKLAQKLGEKTKEYKLILNIYPKLQESFRLNHQHCKQNQPFDKVHQRLF